ncbi:related to Zn-dependent hydrolase (beta-lactamase superfamily) [Cephalotrichum gorgonifer]|uniref:Related to Zn-dependent hydrolase (Beta-lactamase superfamily) n=1 Tax=Cephalotrichum gorgonifer TaxID=2041049 RepID=A0AAE8SVP3_9PEZI|nr:related to Zn-dependent hydrolase (beta-lactamase superfamily) [Cephalotrichum gorgonifer]
MATYSTTVTPPAEPASMPKDGADKIHHVLNGGRLTGFKNPYPSWGTSHGPWEVFGAIFWPMLSGELKFPDTSPPTVPVVKPHFLASRTASDKLRATWLGHACYYVEFASGLRALFDPVFEDRCAPVSFMGPKRYTPKPCDIADLPLVDAVFISHSHYDHLSHGSVLEVQKHHPRAHFFVGKGLESWFRKTGIENVTELDWWEDAELKLTLDKTDKVEGEGSGGDAPAEISARISCTPCQHTSARSLSDRDTTLWCSWGVKSGGKSVWFGGDTGYRRVPKVPKGADDYGPEYEALPHCPQFKQIGDLRGPFDLGLIPIGAYHPRAAFSAMHANPFDSVEIFRDTKCARAMGIHWGTWALTMEEVLEPPRLLRDALKRRGIPETGAFDVCDIGESVEF